MINSSILCNRGVATSKIARHKKPRHDLIVVLHLKSCGAAAYDARSSRWRLHGKLVTDM